MLPDSRDSRRSVEVFLLAVSCHEVNVRHRLRLRVGLAGDFAGSPEQQGRQGRLRKARRVFQTWIQQLFLMFAGFGLQAYTVIFKCSLV